MKNFKNILTILLVVFTSWCAFAQEDELPQQEIDPRVREKVEAARIALITERLALTPGQAERFWPIYREFIQKRQDMRKQFRDAQGRLDPKKPDPKQEQELVKLGLQIKQNEVDLEKDYSGRIMNVITAQQLLNLRRAEQDFRQLILNKLQERRALQQRKEILRDKNQRLRQKRN